MSLDLKVLNDEQQVSFHLRDFTFVSCLQRINPFFGQKSDKLVQQYVNTD